jgi:hypothetical protein
MTLDQLLDGFVIPLLRGGPVHVSRPLRPRDKALLAEELASGSRPELQFTRLRRAQQITPHPALPDPDDDELSLWIGLHNALVFDHPERARVWARNSTWRRVEGATRTLLTLPFCSGTGEALVRHLSVGAFLELRRTDTVVTSAAGELRFAGQGVPRRRFGFAAVAAGTAREETLRFIDAPHAAETGRLIEDAMRASPLTCLLHPRRAPPGWSPLWASDFLAQPGLARAVCHHWAASKDWISIGGAVMSALLPSVVTRSGSARAETNVAWSEGGRLALPGAVLPSGPAAVSAVVGALVHLHFLKVLEFDARLGLALGSRDPGILSFLALPLLLPSLFEVMGTPLSGLAAAGSSRRGGGSVGLESFEAGAYRRWNEYVDHLAELVPRAALENLLAGVVSAIVQTA